ncbi:MAG: NrtA/SsuA/CpmA family ABC transporter substrate-binding protein [Fusobacterium sp.]|nr:NrtA/SsuA/CpmA family ABC transporter substrate-binding protein [Fusobacterium sp.]
MKKIFTFLLSAVFVLGCNKTTTDSNTALSTDKLTITYVTSPLNVPSIVEKNKEFFKSETPNINLNYAEITSGAEQTLALASNDVQILHAVGGSSIIAAAAAGADIKVINMYSRAPKAFAMYSKNNNLISAEDLKGKTIAGPFGTNLHELLVSYLKNSNLNLEDVNFINMNIPDALAALEANKIDVALLGGPAAYKAAKLGHHKISDGTGYIEAIIAVCTSQKYYVEHKDVVDKFIETQKNIRKFMKNNTEETRKIVMEELKIDEEAFNTMYGQYDFDIEIKDKDIEGLQKTADFMYEAKMIKNPVDVKELILDI